MNDSLDLRLGDNHLCIVSALKDILFQAHVGFDENAQTHSALCVLGANWIIRNHKCRSVLVERGYGGKEMPDVIGFYFNESTLLEAKTSRTDFLADAKKEFRRHPEKGMGKYRYYICPKGVISPNELPRNWGLLYVSLKGRIKVIVKPVAFEDYARDTEFLMLTSALANPWKLFSHWTDGMIQRLAGVNWMSKTMGIDTKLFCARLATNRLNGAKD